MIELPGGYINGCYRNGAMVEKHYLSEINVGQSPESRKKREAIALKRHECAPSLVEVNGASIVQEFVSGDCLESAEVDWEFSGIGSPYEDFAICNMWIFGEHGGQEAFWEGYGQTPDEESVRAFEIGK